MNDVALNALAPYLNQFKDGLLFDMTPERRQPAPREQVKAEIVEAVSARPLKRPDIFEIVIPKFFIQYPVKEYRQMINELAFGEGRPAIYCRDTMGVEGEVWIRENPDGSAGVIKGPRGPAWVSFNPSVYEKTPQSQGGTRGNVQIRAYDKCESLRKVLPAKGRRCKNAALEGKELRRDHEKIRARTKT